MKDKACQACNGLGEIMDDSAAAAAGTEAFYTCSECRGSGTPSRLQKLEDKVFALEERLRLLELDFVGENP